MKVREVNEVVDRVTTVFKGEKVTYDSVSLYCPDCDDYFADEDLVNENDIRMKDAYREKMGLLKSSDIVAIRNDYGISQADLCLLLQWGGKTITRYESHQVQDKAHDKILKKISEDPGWYMELLIESKQILPENAFKRYYEIASSLYEKSEDYYLRNIIKASCAKYADNPEMTGNANLSFTKIVDVIRYYASSDAVKNLYKVKLLKMMWYSDFLSYKRRNKSITGLTYLALPMGAVPESHDYIIKLSGVPCEEKMINDIDSYYFHTSEKNYTSLTDEEKEILDSVITKMGKMKAEEIIEYMHMEKAYKETDPKDVISYTYAKDLSLN